MHSCGLVLPCPPLFPTDGASLVCELNISLSIAGPAGSPEAWHAAPHQDCPKPRCHSPSPCFREDDLAGLTVRSAEALSALDALRMLRPPVAGLQVTGMLGRGALGRAYKVGVTAACGRARQRMDARRWHPCRLACRQAGRCRAAHAAGGCQPEGCALLLQGCWAGGTPVAVKVLTHNVRGPVSSELSPAAGAAPPTLPALQQHPNLVIYHQVWFRALLAAGGRCATRC